MAPLAGAELRHKRAASWSKRAEGGDLDAQFIFSWLAFNALYGQARYRHPDRQWSEIADITKFLTLMIKLDHGIHGVLKEGPLAEHVSNLVKDKFLHDCCWRQWDKNGAVDRDSRDSFVPECHEKHTDELVQVFKRLYVLRKQIFHGCSTDGSSKNRPSLRAAVPVLKRFVQAFLDVLKRNPQQAQVSALLGAPPYPPTESAHWNPPRVSARR